MAELLSPRGSKRTRKAPVRYVVESVELAAQPQLASKQPQQKKSQEIQVDAVTQDDTRKNTSPRRKRNVADVQAAGVVTQDETRKRTSTRQKRNSAEAQVDVEGTQDDAAKSTSKRKQDLERKTNKECRDPAQPRKSPETRQTPSRTEYAVNRRETRNLESRKKSRLNDTTVLLPGAERKIVKQRKERSTEQGNGSTPETQVDDKFQRAMKVANVKMGALAGLSKTQRAAVRHHHFPIHYRPETPEKRKRKRWSRDEVKALIIGLQKYGEERTRWKLILTDERLSKYFNDRTTTDLKDKVRNLTKQLERESENDEVIMSPLSSNEEERGLGVNTSDDESSVERASNNRMAGTSFENDDSVSGSTLDQNHTADGRKYQLAGEWKPQSTSSSERQDGHLSEEAKVSDDSEGDPNLVQDDDPLVNVTFFGGEPYVKRTVPFNSYSTLDYVRDFAVAELFGNHARANDFMISVEGEDLRDLHQKLCEVNFDDGKLLYISPRYQS